MKMRIKQVPGVPSAEKRYVIQEWHWWFPIWTDAHYQIFYSLDNAIKVAEMIKNPQIIKII